MKLFITGGTGYIGREFINNHIHKIQLIYLVSRKKTNFKNKKIKVLYGSISDNWQKEMKNSDALIHFAAAGVKNKNISYKDAYKFNVIDSMKLFQNAFKYNLKNWIILGSSSEYGSLNKKQISTKMKPKPKCNYSKTKYIFSKKIINFAIKKNCKCKILRIFPVYGSNEPKQRLFPSLMKSVKLSKNFVLYNGNQLIDYSNIKIVVKKIFKCSQDFNSRIKFPQIWHIASGKPILLKDFARKIWKKNSAKGKLIIIPQTDKHLIHHVSNIKSIWK